VCTIIILRDVSREHPLVIAANRDEYYARAATAPEPIDGAGAIAGIDLEKGGSWMGATRDGFFVGLTNQRTYQPAEPGRRSRGEVVMACLELGDREAVRDYLDGLDAPAYNPFNLIAGDASGLDCAYVRDRGVELAPVPEGISILPNDVIDSAEFPKVARARELLGDDLVALPWPALAARLHRVLGDHARVPVEADRDGWPAALLGELGALCVHTPVYGTRSFTACALSPSRCDHYVFAEGPTCESRPTEITELLYSGQ
jgi:uncharacterized protein with NRDE domain